MADEPQKSSGRFEEVKYSLLLVEIEPRFLGPADPNPHTTMTAIPGPNYNHDVLKREMLAFIVR
jgi:hypothetical protein